tara:strand:+ start:8752 stop:8958 length:207 start_codon:yes stop_codon:yes gene_type:complete
MIEENHENGIGVTVDLPERAVKALAQAVNYTLEKWTGEGELDQEELFHLKKFLNGAILEFSFMRSPNT